MPNYGYIAVTGQFFDKDKIQRKLKTLVTKTVGSVFRKNITQYAKVIKRLARKETPVFTGELKRSIDLFPGSAKYFPGSGHVDILVVARARYARFIHEGTGIYGPRHRAIRKLLIFKIANAHQATTLNKQRRKLGLPPVHVGDTIRLPGSKGIVPRPFFKTAINKGRIGFRSKMIGAGTELIKRVAGK